MNVILVLQLLIAEPAGAELAGVVRDDASAPLAGATVALPDLERASVTDSAGRYRFEQVPAGPHHVVVRRIGYRSRTLHALVPRTGRLDLDVTLSVVPVPVAGLRVRAPWSLRGVESSATSTPFAERSVSAAAIASHPTLAEPDGFRALVGGDVARDPETAGGLHVAGGAAEHTGYALDGIPVLSPHHALGLESAWNPAAIARLSLATLPDLTQGGHVLGGTVSGVTRPPGERWRLRGGASSTQARLALDGPVPGTGVGMLVAVRAGVHDRLAPAGEASYLSGATDDVLVVVESDLAGGRWRALAVGSRDRVEAASDATLGAARHQFRWRNGSTGFDWRRVAGGRSLGLTGWLAGADADVIWFQESGPQTVASRRNDRGLQLELGSSSPAGDADVALRLEKSGTRYATRAANGAESVRDVSPATATLRVRATRRLGAHHTARLGLAAIRGDGRGHLGPRAELAWQPWSHLGVTVGAARTHQFAQSLRNPESVVGHIFPADLFLGAGRADLPVARADLGEVAVEARPRPGSHVGVRAWARRSGSLVLVAPRSGAPFSTGAFALGSSTARGVALEAALRSARFGVLGSYGWQRVRITYGDSAYIPEHGPAQQAEAGLLLFPGATSAVRLGVSAAFGRRVTAVPGTLEWESCNLLDQGCELVGSPDHSGEPLGGTALPPYLRVDVGLRRHWDVTLGGRDGQIAVHGTYANLLGRHNLLTYARGASGERVGIELRPPAVFVVGLDWTF